MRFLCYYAIANYGDKEIILTGGVTTPYGPGRVAH